MNIKIPYAKGFLDFYTKKGSVKGILSSKTEEYKTDQTQEEIVKNALKNPVESKRLKDLAKGAKRVLIITSDHTRPVPSKITMPVLLDEIRSRNPNVQIQILIATGFHRASTYEEMVDKFGARIVEQEEIINHNGKDMNTMCFKGILPSGGELWINSLVDRADLIVSEGFIEPHFFAGFSGGRKSILPGIAAEKSVFSNHCSEFISSSAARTGNLIDNPIHKDMLFAAKVAKLAFILNVVIDGKKKIINAFAGHYRTAHEKGCAFVREMAEVEAMESDIVVTSNGGYPLDQNIYQAVKGMTAAESCVRNGGVIIIAAACNDGHGGEAFYRWFAKASSPEEVAAKISSIPQHETVADQWEAQILARVLMKCRVIMVSDELSRDLIEDMHMTYAACFNDALEIAEEQVGKNHTVTVIPDGVGVIVKRVIT